MINACYCFDYSFHKLCHDQRLPCFHTFTKVIMSHETQNDTSINGVEFPWDYRLPYSKQGSRWSWLNLWIYCSMYPMFLLSKECCQEKNPGIGLIFPKSPRKVKVFFNFLRKSIKSRYWIFPTIKDLSESIRDRFSNLANSKFFLWKKNPS